MVAEWLLHLQGPSPSKNRQKLGEPEKSECLLSFRLSFLIPFYLWLRLKVWLSQNQETTKPTWISTNSSLFLSLASLWLSKLEKTERDVTGVLWGEGARSALTTAGVLFLREKIWELVVGPGKQFQDSAAGLALPCLPAHGLVPAGHWPPPLSAPFQL